jgi:glycerophosphoryl diester phosphodiesterase
VSGRVRRRRGAATVLVVLACLCAVAPSATADSTADTTTAADISALPDTVYVAHRGGAMEARENSLSGLQSALDSGVVQVLEVDTRAMSDGTLVVMHDQTVDRTSLAAGAVRSYSPSTWSLVTLDIGAWLSPIPAPEQAPTLAAVLDRFGGEVVLTVEAKDPSTVGTIADMVRRRGLTGSVYVSTNDPVLARQIHAEGLWTQLWRSADQMQGDDPGSFAEYVDVLDVDINASNADILRFAASGVPRLWTHTLTTRAERDRAKRQGVTGFVTDDPRYLTGLRASYPISPTILWVVEGPGPAQVSDRTTMQLVVTQQAGPPNPEALPLIRGRGVRSTSSIDNHRVRTLVVSTTGAEAGRERATVTVAAGHGPERRWTAGSRTVDLRLSREDLQLRPQVRTEGRRVRLGVRVLDSAAADYTGDRHETGSTRTVAGLHRAELTIAFLRAGQVIWSRKVLATDAGRAAVGDGRLEVTWEAPRRGRYVVRVSQRGAVYEAVTELRRLRVR